MGWSRFCSHLPVAFLCSSHTPQRLIGHHLLSRRQAACRLIGLAPPTMVQPDRAARRSKTGVSENWRKTGVRVTFLHPPVGHASQGRALRYSESQRLPYRALSGVPCQPCHRGWQNHAGHNRPAVPPQCSLCLQRHSSAAGASDLPHLRHIVTTLVFPRSRSQKKGALDALLMAWGALR